MAIGDPPSFQQPPSSKPLWHYTDLPKFIQLLTGKTLWLGNLEILAQNDPYEGLPGPIQFPHRMWKSIDEVPKTLKTQILQMKSKDTDRSLQEAFMRWFMLEEQSCYMSQSGRRNYYVNCWHAAEHESMAMWKIYGALGAGVAIVTNAEKRKSALAANSQQLYLGEVQYRASDTFQIGTKNSFDPIMVKSKSYSYENEVRLVHKDISESYHDPLAKFSWNDQTMRFDDIIEDLRPLVPGLLFQCNLDTLIEKLIISPFAPPWYVVTLKRLKEQLGFRFPIFQSKLLTAPEIIP